MLYYVELVFTKEVILLRQVNEKSLILVTIGIFYIKDLIFNYMPAMVVMMH